MIVNMYSGFKKFTSILDRPAIEMNRYLQKIDILKWMIKGKTTLIQNDHQKEQHPPNNYKPITCLPMMMKILTTPKKEEIYYSLRSSGLFPKD